MKNILLLLVLLSPFCLLPAASAAPVVTIDNASNVRVDGVNYGAPVDAIANNPQLAAAIQTALTAFVQKTHADAQKEKTDHATAKAAELAAAKKTTEDAAAAQVATAQSEKAALATEKSAAEARATAAEARATAAEARLAALVEPLRTLNLTAYPLEIRSAITAAVATDKEKKRAALAAAKAAAEAELTALDAAGK